MLVGTTKRRFSQSYLTLTHTGKDCGNWNHDSVNWIDCMSEPELLPPYSRGAATSKLMTLLRDGHEDVTLTRQELEKIACWIDLLVPFCGDYCEANAWSQEDLDLYADQGETRATARGRKGGHSGIDRAAQRSSASTDKELEGRMGRRMAMAEVGEKPTSHRSRNK